MPSNSSGLLEVALPTVDEAVRFICHRRRCSADEAQEFASFVHLKLLEDECSILRRFEGRSELRTYLAVVLERLFIDFRRHRWGLWRPSAEARRLGPLGVLLDRLVSRDGLTVEEAVETAFSATKAQVSREELRATIDRLPRHTPRRIEGEEALPEMAIAAGSVEAFILNDEHDRRVAEVRSAMHDILESVDHEDAVVLRLRFQDGMTVGQIAHVLQLEAKPLYRRVERLLGHLRSGLEARGVNAGDVVELIEAGAFDAGDSVNKVALP